MLVLNLSLLALVKSLRKLALSKIFIAYIIMYNMLHILIGKKSILSFNCNSSSTNDFAVILVNVHKLIFDYLSRGCSD
jgi:hypothetical protein